MNSLGLIHWLAGAGALALFVYLGYALLRPERFPRRRGWCSRCAGFEANPWD